MKTLLLIDANSIIHRSFHALPPFTAPDGRPTGALYGLSSILLKLWREEKPDYAAALFDRPEPTFREEKYKEYKAQRPPAPDALISQIIEARNLFRKFGVKTFEAPGFEADDLIAALAERFSREPELRIVVLTGDKDTLQLVRGEKIVVRAFKKGVSETKTYDEKAIREEYGFAPEKLVDYKALVGDPSDNIKGVPGVGPKTAAELVKKFGSVENIYKNSAGGGKLERKLAPFAGEARLSKELVTLRRDAPAHLERLGDLLVSEDPSEIKEYFAGLGFATLVERLRGGVGAEKGKKRVSRAGESEKRRDSSLFS